MKLDSLREYCLSLPDATENIQWGADLVFKVGGKMFTVASTEPGETKASFKCTPEEFAELIEHDGIKPADYVARYHWVTLLRWDALPDQEIRRLVKDSYEMVRAKLPKRKSATRKAPKRPAKNAATQTKAARATKTTRKAARTKVSGGIASRAPRKPAGRSPALRSRSTAGGRAVRTRAK